MKVLHKVCAVFAAVSILVCVLVTAAEAAIFLDFDYYRKEYEKYRVLDELDMKMEDVMDVTREMMSYLHGRRSDLVVETTVSGERQEFFNDREKAHMADVERLFAAAVTARRAAVCLLLISVGVIMAGKGNWKKLTARAYMAAVGVFLLLGGILAWLFTKNFSKYFVRFHEIFFDNDLWLLDPATDLMIRMLPEGFFADFAARIGIFAAAAVAAVFVISFAVGRTAKKK